MSEQQPATPENDNIENEISAQEMDRFRLRSLGVLIEKLTALESQNLSLEQQNIYLKPLFEAPAIAALLDDLDIHYAEDESINDLIEELKFAKNILLTEKNQVRPAETAPVVEKINPSFATDEEYKIAGSIEEEINALYALNNQGVDEEQRISEAMARLVVFASDIQSSESVEVARTKSGMVEVLFEEDVQEAEKLQQGMIDVQEAQRRIDEYDQEIAKFVPKQKGFWKSLLKNAENVENIHPRQVELELKKARTEEELALKIVENEAREDRVNMRFQEKHAALEVPLMVSGIDTFRGTWGELLKTIQASAKKTQKSLEENHQERQKQIALLEEKRGTSNTSHQEG